MAGGDGGLVQRTDTRTIVRFGRPLMFPSLASAVDSESALVLAGARSAGFRLDLVTFSIPGGDGGAAVTATLISAHTIVAALLRCAPDRDFQT